MVRKQLDVDFFTPEVIAEPYPVYEQIRAVGDVVWNERDVGRVDAAADLPRGQATFDRLLVHRPRAERQGVSRRRWEAYVPVRPDRVLTAYATFDAI